MGCRIGRDEMEGLIRVVGVEILVRSSSGSCDVDGQGSSLDEYVCLIE